MDKILLIDGYSIVNRAFYGLPDLTNSKGMHTNALLGFLNIMFKVIEEEQPTHLCVAFDVKAPTFRHKMFEAYKGTRRGMPEELKEQVPYLKEILTAMNIKIMEKEGYEADDVIGTLSQMAEKNGMKVSVISGDRDLLQLATDTIKIRIPKTKAKGTVVEDYYAKDVEELYGVTPLEFIDLKGLMGDTSDNIPGVTGIGEKTATKIIMEYKSIENALEHIDEIKPAKAQNNLRAEKEIALLSKTLATICTEVPVEVDFDTMKVQDMFNEKAYVVFKEYELKSHLSRFQTGTKENAKLELNYEIVTDFSKACEIKQNAVQAEKKGIHLLRENDKIYGLGIAFGTELYVMKQEGFISDGFLLETMDEVLKSQNVFLFGLKEVLKGLTITESSEKIYDLHVISYLLNPILNTYDYELVAKDWLHQTLKSKEELFGKKKLSDLFEEDYELLCQFAASNAKVAFEAGELMLSDLKEKQMFELYEEIEYKTIFALFDMEQRGIGVNKEALKIYGDSLVSRIEQLENEIYELSGEKFNINSPKQLGEVLFEHLKLPAAKKTKTGYSTSVEVLEGLAADYPIVEKILEYRQYTKLKSTYADGLLHFIKEDGRIYGKFHQTITATGRISSTDPNLQNIPIRMPLGREIRKVFVPKEGYVFLDADYSQIELRVFAHVSGDENLIKAYKEKQDIHALTASQVFHVPIEEVTDLQRRNAKAVNFGIVYGISAFGLSQDLKISRKEAQEYMDKYFSTYPKVKEFLDSMVAKAKETGEVETIYHRIRPIPELKSSNFMQRSFGERVAMNSPIQGTAADIIKLAMIAVNMKLKENHLKSQMILQIHDELLVETLVEEKEQVAKILEEEMMNVAKLLVPLEVEVKSGNNWFEAK